MFRIRITEGEGKGAKDLVNCEVEAEKLVRIMSHFIVQDEEVNETVVVEERPARAVKRAKKKTGGYPREQSPQSKELGDSIAGHYKDKETKRKQVTPEVLEEMKKLKGEGFSVAEIAVATGFSEQTVYNKLGS